MIALGVDTVLPPVSSTDPDYQAKVARLGGRAKASEMEHAIRHHIRLHADEDPVRYRRLSENLERILAEHAGNWEQLALSLTTLLQEMTTIDPERARGDSPNLNQVESALYGLLAEETATDGVIGADQGQRLTDFARRLYELARRQTTRRDFWRHSVDQYGFISELTTALVLAGIVGQEQAPALASATGGGPSDSRSNATRLLPPSSHRRRTKTGSPGRSAPSGPGCSPSSASAPRLVCPGRRAST